LVGLATAFFVLTTLAALAVLWPREQWAFNLSPKAILSVVEDPAFSSAPADVYRELALRIGDNYAKNEARLERSGWYRGLFGLFRFGCASLAAEIIFWIVDLWRGGALI
jgi:hypothetical protein